MLTETVQEHLNKKLTELTPSKGDVRCFLTAPMPPSLVTRNLTEDEITTIRVPPMRVRSEDIEAEAKMLLRNIQIREGDPTPRAFSEEGLRVLQAHDWPGNDEDLGIMIGRAVVQMCEAQHRDRR